MASLKTGVYLLAISKDIQRLSIRTPIPHMPYLGIIVLPSDMQMPKGQTEAGLIAGIGKGLEQTKEFWWKLPTDSVDITTRCIRP